MALNQRTASPWWASLTFFLGLALLFIGQRGLVGELSDVLPYVGAAAALGATLARVVTTVRSRGGRRRVERTLLACQLVACLGLVVYFCTTKTGLGLLGLDSLTDKAAARYGTSMLILAALLWATSLIPLAMIEFTLGTARREGFDLAAAKGEAVEDAVEYRRVRELGLSGLSIGLALAFLMVTCQTAREKNVRKDVSYFKTSSPGGSTVNIVKNSAEPFAVELFFPASNEVGREVRGYFDDLAAATGGKITVARYDRMVDAPKAEAAGVKKDGTVVVRRGEGDKAKKETFEVDTDLDKARRGKGKLRTLDREVNSRLLKLVREKRKAYLTVGHGEINDLDSVPAAMKDKVPPRQLTSFRARLTALNYETKELGLMDLLQGEVPEDATMVMMLGPVAAPAEAELEALDRYLARGGRLLVALDPRGEAGLGAALEARLGVRFDKGGIVDDKAFFPATRTKADRRWAGTTQFSAHASTTTLSRAADKSGLLLIDAGVLLEVPFAAGGEDPKRTFVVRTMPTAWQDWNGNLDFDATGFDGAPAEKRDRYNVIASIEGPKLPPGDDGEAQDGFRAMVTADVDLFADLRIAQAGMVTVDMVGGPLLDDAVKWLGGEEVFAGDVVSEEDVAIKHSQETDGKWFLGTIFGAPILVLGLGLTLTRRRRRAPAATVAKKEKE